LTNYCLKRLKVVDKKYKSAEDFNRSDPVAEKAANVDVMTFMKEMEQTDRKLRGTATANGSNEIFTNSNKENESGNNDFVAQLQLKNTAENERLKGNEFMKSREYDAAVECYTKSIEIFPDEAASYSNRAMAYLKLKKYGSCIDDAERALEIQPDYLKAYHRRGKACLASGKYEEAIEDFQYILAKEPDNNDINASLMEARRKVSQKEA